MTSKVHLIQLAKTGSLARTDTWALPRNSDRADQPERSCPKRAHQPDAHRGEITFGREIGPGPLHFIFQ